MERERLSSMLLEFQAHHEALVPRATGRLLHALFLNLIAQFDEACSQQLHDEPHYRPFTVSSLQGAQICEGYALLRRGHTYTCRVTLFDGGDLQQQFQTYVRQTHTIPVHLDNAVLSLTKVISTPAMDSRGWINSTTWKKLVTLPPADLITMRFLSPTAFSMGDRAFKLFPDPTWVWGSLLRDWNRYAPACFQVDKMFIQEATAAAICVTSCLERECFFERCRGGMKMASPLAYIIDTLRFDVYVNCSSSSNQSSPTKVHPWLTLCMEPVSRRVLASYLSEHRPNLESIKAILYEAFFADDENKHSASLPDEIWCDAGIGFPSLQSLTQMLHIPLCSAPLPAKGLIERLFLHIQNACIPVCSPGQDGSGTNFIAESTLSELEERFVQFLLHYHHQIQSSTGLTPLESWQEQCRPSAFDSHILYLLLQDGGERRVVKDGIHYRKNLYWHSDLALYVGKEVSIRMKPTQSLPETIGVFFERQWICSAFLQEGANGDHLRNENERI